MRFLHELILGAATARPQQEAVVSPRKAWTYATLARSSGGYARALADAGLGSGQVLALTLERGPEAIALLAACSSLGIVFIPLDRKLPESRLRALLQEIEPDCVVTEDDGWELGASPWAARMEDERLVFLRQGPAGRGGGPGSRLIDSSLAYVIFTSGSTGRPKGIMMTQLAAVSFMEGLIADYGLRPGERYASTSPLHFDYCLLDLLLVLGSGGTLLLPNRDYISKPAFLAAQLRSMGAGHFSGVPTIWKLMLQFAPEALEGLTGLRRIAFAGEHFPLAAVRAIYDALPGVEIYNIYGQSESIACAFQVLPRPLEPGRQHLPVGTGHPDAELLLLDQELRPVTRPDTVGELYLRGRILFSGYWKDPASTSRRLLPHPLAPTGQERVFRSGDLCYFDAQGRYYFVGRGDNQVKINGNRVELEEIETVLGGHPDVANACVVVEIGERRSTLRAAVVARGPADAAALTAALRQACAGSLPAYMCPQSFELWDAMPLTANHKVDRQAVKERLLNRAAV